MVISMPPQRLSMIVGVWDVRLDATLGVWDGRLGAWNTRLGIWNTRLGILDASLGFGILDYAYGMLVHCRVNSCIKVAGTHFKDLAGRGPVRVKYIGQGTTECFQSGFDLPPLNLEFSAGTHFQ